MPAAAIPLATRELIEVLLERLDAASGRWRVVVEAADGRVHLVDRQECKISASGLERFDAAPEPD